MADHTLDVDKNDDIMKTNSENAEVGKNDDHVKTNSESMASNVDEGTDIAEETNSESMEVEAEIDDIVKTNSADMATNVDEGFTLEDHESKKNIIENEFTLIKRFTSILLPSMLETNFESMERTIHTRIGRESRHREDKLQEHGAG
jgi:hypothetical protein